MTDRDDIGQGAFRLGDWRVEPRANRVEVSGTAVTLEPRVMDTLVCLARHHGEVVSREQLIEEVWQGRSVTDDAINRCILALRNLYRKAGGQGELIATVRKRGYQLLPEPEAIEGPAAKRPARRIAVYLGAVALVAAALWLWPREGPAPDRLDPAAEAPAIAVLPFANSTGEPGKDYLAAAFTDALTARLGREPRLIVISSATVNSPQLSTISPARAALQLKADYLVDGEVGQADGAIRVDLNVRGGDGELLWSGSFASSAPGDDLLEVGTRIARRVASLVGEELSAVEVCPWSHNPQALELYFRARHEINRRQEENLRRAVELLKQAIEADPDFARAYSMLSFAYVVAPNWIFDRERRLEARAAMGDLAKTTARLALERCAALGEAYLMSGQAPEGPAANPWVRLELIYRKALSLEPNNGRIVRLYADHLDRVGRHEEAFQYGLRARRINPLDAHAHNNLAYQYLYRGDFEAAREADARSKELGNHDIPMIDYRIAVATRDRALLEKVLAHEHFEPRREIERAVMDALEDPARKERALDLLGEEIRKRLAFRRAMGIRFGAMLGDLDLAFEAADLNRWDIGRFFFYELWNPAHPEFRRDPRFLELLRSLDDMPAYWARFGNPDFCRWNGAELACEG